MSTSEKITRPGFVRGLGIAVVTGLVIVTSAAQAATKAPAKKDVYRAQDRYFMVGFDYLAAGSERNADYGIGFNAGYGGRLGLSRWWELKIFTNILETGATTAIDFYRTGAGLDVLQPLGNENYGHFFVLGGGGVAINDVKPDTNDGTSTYANLGLGWRAQTSERWGLRPRIDLRYVYDTIGDGASDVLLGFTLEIPPKRERIVERIVEVEKIVEVPVIVEKIVERDVVCVVPTAPVTIEAPPVDVDSDNDGVPDGKDKCPQTLAGAKVDAEGCVQEEQTISLPNIEFEPASTVLAAGGKDNLEKVVSFLQNQAGVKIDVFGHTDSQGKDAYNQKLSDGRAKSVMDYLVSRGIAAERLSSKGFGETQPIASNETKEGRAKNRRVELLIRTKK